MYLLHFCDACNLAVLFKVVQVELDTRVLDPRLLSLFVVLEILLIKDVFEILSDFVRCLEPFANCEVEIAVFDWRQVNVLLNQLDLLILVLRKQGLVFDQLLVLMVRFDPLI